MEGGTESLIHKSREIVVLIGREEYTRFKYCIFLVPDFSIIFKTKFLFSSDNIYILCTFETK